MIDKKIKCVHCGHIFTVKSTDVVAVKCQCGKVGVNNGVIIEGAQGTDWVDISQQLLNG